MLFLGIIGTIAMVFVEIFFRKVAEFAAFAAKFKRLKIRTFEVPEAFLMSSGDVIIEVLIFELNRAVIYWTLDNGLWIWLFLRFCGYWRTSIL